MPRFRFLVPTTCIALSVLFSAGLHAADVSTLTQRAERAAHKGNTSLALGMYELALTQSADQPESVFGPLDGQYLRLIAKSGDFPRALNFFSALRAQQKTPSASLLADRANAIGGYIGWLQQNNLADGLSPVFFKNLDATARRNYNQALALDPDNFSALYGFAIYESYSPNGKPHMQELLAKLNALRSSHPQYPWQMVDYLEQHGHPQQ